MWVFHIRVLRTRIVRARVRRVRGIRLWQIVGHRPVGGKLGVLVDREADTGEATRPGVLQALANDVAVGLQLAQRRADGGLAVAAMVDEVGDADLPVIGEAEEVAHQAFGPPRERLILGDALVDHHEGVRAVLLAADNRLRHRDALRSAS